MSDNLSASLFAWLLYGGLPLVVVVGALIVVARAWGRARDQDRATVEAERAALERHDDWRRTASKRAFKRHERSCPRCRGDVLFAYRFAEPPASWRVGRSRA